MTTATHPPAEGPADLPRLLMRRAAAVAVAVLCLALALGLLRMRADMDEEFAAARSLAGLLAQLGRLAGANDAAAAQGLADLRLQLARQPPHHLQLLLHDADGRALLQPLAPEADPAPVLALLWLHRALSPGAGAQAQVWPLARPEGGPWTVTLQASHESERREALFNLLGTLALLLLCVAGLLLVMRWNVRRALAPLDWLLAAIQGRAGLDARALQALPPMPIRELERLAAALRQLATALDAAEGRRRLLGQQVLTLQEDERARLARELHDEMGQRLTGLRADATWLARRLAEQPAVLTVVQGMATQCAGLQQDVRGLLARLQPFEAGGASVSLAQLCQMLGGLVASWRPAGWQGEEGEDGQDGEDGEGTEGGQGGRQPPQINLLLPDAEGEGGRAGQRRLPQALVLALYRISQEALTNVARHAQARQAVLRLGWSGGDAPGQAVCIRWAVQDDGIGLVQARRAQQQGNGLSGLQERVWAQGGDLQFGPGLHGRGLGLSAQFEAHWLAADAALLAPLPAGSGAGDGDGDGAGAGARAGALA